MTPHCRHIDQALTPAHTPHSTVVSDAGAGGQVLLCESTFHAIKDLTGELGCVTEDGLDLDKLVKPPWWSWWR